jgi:GDSL-like Lipase/Acylhydrolase family
VATGVGANSSYVERLFPHYQSTLGVTELSNRAAGGESSGSIRSGSQLDNALADINAASDTRAVTIEIGANDSDECADRWDSCPFRFNLFATLSDLGAALDSDPGAESFAAMAYYNPASGQGGQGLRSEPYYDRGLLGTNLVIDCEITAAPEVGINDVIHQEAGRRGALVADPYAAFKAGGQGFMADDIHPNDAGQAPIAAAFREASAVCPKAGGLPLPSPLPSNFSFGKMKKNKRKGTATLTVEVPAPGELDLAKTKEVKAYEGAITHFENRAALGGAFVSIKPKGKAKKKLNNEGKAKVKAIVTYTRTGGSPNTKDKKIKLVKR